MGGLSAVLGLPGSALVRPSQGLMTYIPKVAYVSTVKTPIFRTDITLASRAKGETTLRPPLIERRFSPLVGQVVVYPPKGRALLQR